MGSDPSKPKINKPKGLTSLLDCFKRSNDISDSDYKKINDKLGLNVKEFDIILKRYKKSKDDGLNKEEFVQLYANLISVKPEILKDIAEHIFNCFDDNKNGLITLDEFIVIFNQSLTSKNRNPITLLLI